MKQAHTIDEAIEILTEIVENAKRDNSCIGIFAALYRKVTIRIKEGIARGEFEDNPRMEQLDVIFANRYILAYEQQKIGVTPTQSWAISFSAVKMNEAVVLQHLLLGINAHINLDLGIAAVETVGTNSLGGLLNDFNKINDVLAELVEDVQLKISKISPLIGLLNRLAGNADERLTNFSIKLARDGAWRFSQRLYTTRKIDRPACIEERDRGIAILALNLAKPNGRWMRTVLQVIKLFESKNVAKVIDVLM